MPRIYPCNMRLVETRLRHRFASAKNHAIARTSERCNKTRKPPEANEWWDEPAFWSIAPKHSEILSCAHRRFPGRRLIGILPPSQRHPPSKAPFHHSLPYSNTSYPTKPVVFTCRQLPAQSFFRILQCLTLIVMESNKMLQRHTTPAGRTPGRNENRFPRKSWCNVCQCGDFDRTNCPTEESEPYNLLTCKP